MHLSRRFITPLSVAVLSLVVSACGGQGTDSSTTSSGGEGEYVFGSLAEPADADRTVEIAATDSLLFEPAEVTVAAGETITFRIVNQGNLVHDFTLGDQATQDEHEAEMAEMGDMAHDQPNVVTIPGGETKELTWTFAQAGTVLIGCHQPGHYDAGMKGQIVVDS
jgi:uncharacterized cupredoxin-like copper-binding protein